MPGDQAFNAVRRRLAGVRENDRPLGRGALLQPLSYALVQLALLNKLDRLGREPLKLIGEIESVLGIPAAPMNWPIGQEPTFRGIYDLDRRTALMFERLDHGQWRVPAIIGDLRSAPLEDHLGRETARRLCEEVELMSAVGPRLDRVTFLAGGMTPVFLGSALNNLVVEPFLAALKELAPSPPARESDRGYVEPTEPRFSGFVFKFKQTWIRSIGIVWRSSAYVQDGSNAI